VEADDLRPELLDQLAKRRVERRAVARRHRRRRIDPQLAIIGREPVAPTRLAGVAQLRQRMTEEIDVDRLVGAGAEFGKLLAQRIGAEQAGRQGPEPARRRNFGGEIGVGRSRHRRLDDRLFDTQQLGETAVRPHESTSTAASGSASSNKRPR
jgi:hypothetical protein